MGDVVNTCLWNIQAPGRVTHLSCFCPTAKCEFKEIISQHRAVNTFICVCVCMCVRERDESFQSTLRFGYRIPGF